MRYILFLLLLSSNLFAASSPWIYGSGGPKSLQPLANGVCESTANVLTCGLSYDDLLPSQSGNSGKFLSTNGTTASWQTAGGTGTVTTVTSTGGSIDITSPTTTPNLSLHFPIAAPNGTAAAPSYSFSGSGMYSAGFGALNFSTAGVAALEINNNQEAVFTNTVAADDFIYPTKTANTFLSGPASGSPAIPGFRAIQSGDIPSSAIPYPLAGSGTVAAPDFGTPGGGMYSIGFGVIGFSTNGVERLRIENNGPVVIGNGGSGSLTVNGDGVFTGNISAANYPPTITGNANELAYYNPSGNLDSVNGWSIDSTNGGINGGTTLVSGTNFFSLNPQVQGGFPVTGDVNLMNPSLTIDDVVTGNARLFNSYMQGGGSASNIYAGSLFVGIPSLNDLTFLDLSGNSTAAGNFNGLNFNSQVNVTGSGQQINMNNNGNFGGNFNQINGFTNGIISGDFRHIQMGNNGDVAGFSSAINIGDNNTITKGLIGFAYYHSGNVGDGSGVNYGLVDGNLNNGTMDGAGNIFNFNSNAIWNQNVNGVNIGFGSGPSEIKGDLNFINLSNSAVLTGNNNLRAMAFTNNADGYRVVAGISSYTDGDMTEEIRGDAFTLKGDSRTKTGIDLNLEGNTVDDVTALKINVTNQTTSSTSNHVRGYDQSGGTFSVQGSFTPFNGVAVDIGNGLSMTTTIANGAPLTGTDTIIQLIQSNLLVNDDIATGPFGLDTNMVGAVSQIAVDTGKTVPLVRSLLLGTTTPSGSGGTISKHVVLELLGLASFGGSVSNPIRYGIEDATLLGQNFCDGATDCRFINEQDPNARSVFAGPVNGDQGFRLSTSGAQPTCDVDHRGLTWNIEGAAGVADIFQVCQKTVLDTYVWVNH